MMQGIQQPMIVFTTDTTSHTGALPSTRADLRMPYQNTPEDVYRYLVDMGFIPTTGHSGDLWARKGTNGYFTWEQAVAYCLIKPFLNP